MTDRPLRIAYAAAPTAVEGPYERLAVWTQGCSLRCPGCCNPELFPAQGGRLVQAPALVRLARLHGVEGLTFLGGEPLEQLEGTVAVARAAQEAGLGVIVFTGFTAQELRPRDPTGALQGVVDTLVCGRFEASRIDHTRGVIGSTNQELVHYSDRYARPSLWMRTPAAELHAGTQGVRVIGRPELVRRSQRAL